MAALEARTLCRDIPARRPKAFDTVIAFAA
jgi:hypothetical protein